ncbi:hypothetical protein GCM10025734_35820 [Kitasatospora paranensis]
MPRIAGFRANIPPGSGVRRATTREVGAALDRQDKRKCGDRTGMGRWQTRDRAAAGAAEATAGPVSGPSPWSWSG